ncbi:DUF4255 domain-containing protein [Natrinema hispanicum]|uniref:Pvc16 N-terminal domain-containing protein n=1 Tax=Natrinema hispanicum TaxID=392421 RepID=A0A1G6R6R8_9EURY|nr:DUF4255 domain-containing protein [Natrinema hispanicum]SDC99747.1 Protein of unknown function [Natrinema hispanicum]SET71866.1 Protein of unknown function [Natrinema hispanicum]
MTYSAIADVSNVLLELLKANAGERSPIDSNRIEVASPADVDSLSSVDITLYPYQIETDTAMGSGSRTISGTARQDRPLALSVRYLVTAYAVGDGSDDGEKQTNPFKRQQRLGAALQLFHDNSRIEPADAPAPLGQEQPLSISIVDEPVEELLSLWSQLSDVSHQPSATIEVSPVVIQSLNESEFTRVEEHETTVGRRSETSDQHAK